MQLACGSEGLWRRLCAEFGLDPEAPGMATNGERVGTASEVIELLEGAFADIPAEDLLARLAAAGVPAGKVRTIDEVYGWDQALSQGLLVDVDHATLGRAARCPGRRCGSSPPAPTARPRPPAATTPLRRCSAPTATRSGPGCRRRRRRRSPTASDVEDGHAT